MGALESNTTLIYGVHIRESANDGSDFSNAAADYRVLFLGEDGNLHVKDSAGAVTDIGGGSGSVATDAIWDAAGDLAVGSGANTAARLAIGATNGMHVERVSGAVAWALPSGYEFDYAERTSNLSVTATTEGTSQAIITGASVSYDGSTRVCIEFYCSSMVPVGNQNLYILLYEDSTVLGILATTNDSGSSRVPVGTLRRFRTPSNASHTYAAKAFTDSATATINAGSGGSGAYLPAYLRVTKA